MSTDNSAQAQHAGTVRRKLLLLVDALFAVADQALDVLLVYEYAVNGNVIYFCIGVATLVAPVILYSCNCCCPDCGGGVEGQMEMGLLPCLGWVCGGMLSYLILLVPGVNLLSLALGAVVLGDASGAESVYKNARAFEAFFEAGPQVIFQVFIALGTPDGINIHILFISLGSSLASLTKTLVTFFIFEDFSDVSYRQRDSRNDFSSGGVKAILFALSLIYELCEVISKVLSVALLGYFCGWLSIAGAIASEYALLLIYLYCAGFQVFDFFDSDRHGSWRYLLLPFTSFVCGRAMSFRSYMFVRLVILGVYASVAIHIKRGEAHLNSLSEIFTWVAVSSTGLWVILMPAFVNSCHNLGVAFYSWSEERIVPKRFTKCFYPLEIDDNKSCICGGMHSRMVSSFVEMVGNTGSIAIDFAQ